MAAYSRAKVKKLLQSVDAATTEDAKGEAFEEMIIISRQECEVLTSSEELVQLVKEKVCDLVIKRTAIP
jgi:hypothetical protein